jgi:sensor domain CHASE-containing protein/signal transduction histidine kinase
MTLRKKTILLISATVAALILILFGITNIIVLRGFLKVEKDLSEGFSRIERRSAERDVRRAVDALNARIVNLSVKASDWAMWDDTYRFVNDRNNAYIESNLTEDALGILKMNLLMIVNSAGQVVIAKAFDLEAYAALPVPVSVNAFFKPGCMLLMHSNEADAKTGIVMLPENPMMIVSRPITRSDGRGPIRGSVIFGRYLDDREFADIASVTHLTVDRHRLDQQAGPPKEFQNIIAMLRDDAPIVIQPLNGDTIAGYTICKDAQNVPAIIMRVNIFRDIHQQGISTIAAIRHRGQVTLISLIISILAAGGILGGVIMLLLESAVLSRLARLSTEASTIGSSGDFHGRVSVSGTDEMAGLAREVNHMLEALALSHGQIAVRNAEMNLLMNTVPAGLLSLDEHFRVNPEYSALAATIFNDSELRERDYADLIGLTAARADDRHKLLDFFDVFRQELLPEKEMAALNPFEELLFVKNGVERWLRLRYFLIHRPDNQPCHILVIAEDITAEKALAEQASRSQRENVQLKAIAENPDLFREFLVETRQILLHIETASAGLRAGERIDAVIHQIFRGVHTIKGVAGSFGLFTLAELSGSLETRLSPLRESGEIGVEERDEVLNGIAGLSKTFAEVVESSRKFLGDDIESEAGIYLRIPLRELKRQIVEIQSLQIEGSLKDRVASRIKDEIVKRLKTLQTVPAYKGLARSLKIIPGLIERIGKNVDFHFEGKDIPLDCEIAYNLNTPLIHMIRNALDHGIESAEERAAAGKSAKGELSLKVSLDGGYVNVILADDGCGLDPGRLKARAVAMGLVTQPESEKLSAEHCFGFIFQPGFSTADEVTDVSGRGVGLNAAIDVVHNRLKGEIDVVSNRGHGTAFSIRVPVGG